MSMRICGGGDERISPFERTNWFVDWSRIDGARGCTVWVGESHITAIDFGSARNFEKQLKHFGMKL